MNSSGATDGGTTHRIVKAMLQDMQMNSDGVFWFFTANDIDHLPDALIDRCDVWNVDLPQLDERREIWGVQIAKRKRNPKDFDLARLSQLTDGFSGRQIEQAWLKAMTRAFNDGKREPCDMDVASVLGEFVPTSRTMAESIERRRKRLEGRAKQASRSTEAQPQALRKLALNN